MKKYYKSVSWVLAPIIFLALIAGYLLISGYLSYFTSDRSWIRDLDYRKDEVHPLTFSWFGSRGCPEIPVQIGERKVKIIFDTGCGTGLMLTSALQGKVGYQVIDRIELLNRDGSHRGWSEYVLLDNLSVFGHGFEAVHTMVSDWRLYSNRKFNGIMGLSYFQGQVVTLDYTGRRIAVMGRPLDYSRLDQEKHIVLPLYKTTTKGQEYLPFFEARLENMPVMVYLDTGKNHSYVLNADHGQSIHQKPSRFSDVTLMLGDKTFYLKNMVEVFDLAQADGLPNPSHIELNSDQIWKLGLIVTFDLIENNIIFRKP